MFTIHGRRYRLCDGLTRRSFLTAGAIGFGGLTLADLLRAEAAAGQGSSRKAIIQIHLDGGPPQMDMIDLKPHGPSHVRGEFTPIGTRIPGFHLCELLPRLADIADRFVFIRSLVGAAGRHDAFQCQSGFSAADLASIGGRPALGSILNKLSASTADVTPPFVDLMQGRPLVRNSARPGFLGPAYGAFRPDISRLFDRPLEDKMVKELANQGPNHVTTLRLNKRLDAGRMRRRTELLEHLDHTRRQLDSSGMMEAMDHFHQQAANILTSGRFAEAMDLSREDPRVVQRYACPASRVERHKTADNHLATRKLLLARRLVEAGVRCVSVSLSDFDTHDSNYQRLRQMLPILDRGLYALVTDLEERGMLDDVSIVVWGEFGRTPKINPKGGRDHWRNVAMAMLAGGGIRAGQVIGATDRTASTVVARPIHYQDVLATLYHNLGIDARRTTITDPTGRPQYLLDRGVPIHEVV